MNIAVILTKDQKEGGVFQHALSLSLFLEKNRSEKYNFIFFTTSKETIKLFKNYQLKFNYFSWSRIDRFLNFLLSHWVLSSIFTRLHIGVQSKFDRIMKKYNINLAYFLNSSDLALATESFNYIFPVWDLCFEDYKEFPEVYAKREFERRNHLYQMAIRKAVRIVTDSIVTKKRISQIYHINENRIILQPFFPSRSVDIEEDTPDGYIGIKKKYKIDGEYIFYPAQFWPHKNHIYILEALKIMKEKYKIKISAVFSGSDRGNLKFVLNKARQLCIEEQVFCIGFVGENEIPGLYKQALALVMPTYFGPTNIPPLEAFKLGCPVLYSDLPDLRDQVKDAVIPLDLKNPESLCEGLLKVIEHPPEIDILINNGKKKIEALENENYWPIFKAVFDDYNQKIKCWK